MKHLLRSAFAAFSLLMVMSASADSLVLIQTNDTHSQIDPNDKGLGGIARRKVVVDSIRNEHANVMLIDCGDAVQGTLFFNVYQGEVETKMMNKLGYDLAILGNHDFDNGVTKLAQNLANSNAIWVATNYQLDGSELEPYFKPYVIKEFDGKKVAFIALNLQPKGMISEGNYDGVVYIDAIKAANATAWHLKHNEKVDLVVALSHLGYDGVPSPVDTDLATASEDIDIILGGHSHTTIIPGSGKEWIANANGQPVLVVQSGKAGQVISEVEIDLDNLGKKPFEYRQIAINSRLDDRVDPSFVDDLAPYRVGVDEMMSRKIGKSARELPNNESALLNFLSDFAMDVAEKLVPDGKIDTSIMNKGGLRRGIPKGDITEGIIMQMQPFDNRVLVEELSGADLLAAFEVMATRNGDGVGRGTVVTYDPATHKVVSAKLNGKPIDPAATYRVATIDYLAKGGDYMEPLTNGNIVASSGKVVYDDMIQYIKAMKGKLNPADEARFRPAK